MAPAPPVRALAIAAGTVMVGAALAVAADSQRWWVGVTVLGVVLVVLGATLGAWALLAARRMRVRVLLDDTGFRVEGPGQQRSGSWAEITRVTRAAGRITLHQGEEQRVHLVVPRGGSADLDALAADIAHRMDASRGYSSTG